MAANGSRERIGNATGFLHLITEFLDGEKQPDPEDEQIAEDCYLIAQEVVDDDVDVAAMVVMAGIKMSHLVPDQPIWRKSAVLSAILLAEKVGGYSPETTVQLDEQVEGLHTAFPDDAYLEEHWYHLIGFRLAAETEADDPSLGLETFERLKRLTGDENSVSPEHAHALAYALFVMCCSARAYGQERVRNWYADLETLHRRFPDNPDVESMSEKATAAMHGGFEAAVRERDRQNSLFGKLKRMLFGR